MIGTAAHKMQRFFCRSRARACGRSDGAIVVGGLRHVAVCLVALLMLQSPWAVLSACPGRSVLTEASGVIASGGAFYHTASTCEWLINATAIAPRAAIVLDFIFSMTECNYDYVFVFDGPSYASAKQLAVVTGDGLTSSPASTPSPIVSTTGYMLVLLFSDPAYVRKGINATYRIVSCPDDCGAASGWGTCLAGSCQCNATRATASCGIAACVDNCNADKGWGTCDPVMSSCACVDGHGGANCSDTAPSASVGGWYSRRLGARVLGRASHTAVLFKSPERTVVFGGYSLSDGVLSDLAVFEYATGVTTHIRGANQSWPSARYGHAAAAIDNADGSSRGMLVCGGTDAALDLMQSSWMLDAGSLQWTRKADMPVNVSFHSANYVRGVGVIVYGGKSYFGPHTGQMWRYDVDRDAWSEMPQYGAVPSGVAAHVSVYVAAMDALVIHGGVRFGSSGDPVGDLYLYRLSTGVWTTIAGTLPTGGGPRGRFLHSAALWSSGGANATVRLFIYGGMVHNSYSLPWSTDGDEECQAMDSFVYDFACNSWTRVPAAEMSASPPLPNASEASVAHSLWMDPLLDAAFRTPSPRRFGSAAVARANGEIVIIGGYAGVMQADVSSLRLPPYDLAATCPSRESLASCASGDGACSWCPALTTNATSVCAGVGSAAVQTCGGGGAQSLCGSLCASLVTCQGCASVRGCNWCPSSQKCARATIGCPSDAAPAVVSLAECATALQSNSATDGGPLTARELYAVPADSAHSVLVLISAPFFGTRAFATVRVGGAAVPRGSLDSSQAPANTDWWGERFRATFIAQTTGNYSFHFAIDGIALLFVRATAVATSDMLAALATASADGSQPVDPAQLWPAYYANPTVDVSEGSSSLAVGNAKWRAVSPPVVLAQGDTCVIETLRLTAGASGLLSVGWSKTDADGVVPAVPTAVVSGVNVVAYVNPFPDRVCPTALNCRTCVADAGCSWCGGLGGLCVARDNATACAGAVSTTEEDACPTCLALSGGGCEECNTYTSCQWRTGYCEDVTTELANNAGSAVTRGSPAACGLRFSCPAHADGGCDSCLATPGCMWCERFDGTGACGHIDGYVSSMYAGMCARWMFGQMSCGSCEALGDCVSCSQLRGCGWCYDPVDPRRGKCVRGDFAGASPANNATCAAAVGDPSAGFAYAMCPDIDECALGLHNCNDITNSHCTNTVGGFTCTCNTGYEADASGGCAPVCDACANGTCVAPNTCVCRLGFTGPNCGVDCGCNGNSVCTAVGVGTCDLCQRNTTGRACDRCAPGFYGNARNGTCRACACNGHADAAKGYCNATTGDCECAEGYAGAGCSLCQTNFVGSGVNGGTCYSLCDSRKMLTGQTGGIGTVSTYAAKSTCQWLIMPDNAGAVRLTVQRFATECSYDYLFVYDGVSAQSPLLAALSGPALSNYEKELVTTGPAALVVFYSDVDFTLDGFRISYEALACPSNCSYSAQRGVCQVATRTCVCGALWKGPACDQLRCPDSCGVALGRGRCVPDVGCVCTRGYAGPSCSFTVTDGVWYAATTHLLSPERGGHSAVYVASSPERIVVFGGLSLRLGALGDLAELNLETGLWTNFGTQSPPSSPGPRFQHSAVVIGGNMYVFGGVRAGASYATDNRLYAMNLTTRIWTIVTTQGDTPVALSGHGAFASGANMYVVGGFLGTVGLTTRVSEFNTNTGRWRRLYPAGYPSMSSYGAAVAFDPVHRVAFVYGGVRAQGLTSSTKVSSLVFRFELPSADGDHGRWGSVLQSGATGRALGAMVYVPATSAGTEAYFVAFGGSSFDHNTAATTSCYASDLAVFDPDCEKFFAASLSTPSILPVVSSAAIGRQSHAVVSGANRTVYVVGGFNGVSRGDVVAMRLPATPCSLSPSACLAGACVQIAPDCTDFNSCADCVSYAKIKNCQWCDGRCRAVTQPASSTCRATCSECTARFGCNDCFDNSAYLLAGVTPVCQWTSGGSSGAFCGTLTPSAVDPNAASRYCVSPCSTRSSCSACTTGGGNCAWCENMGACLDFNVYTAAQGMGQCRSWQDENRGCSVDCGATKTCGGCLGSGRCGWCAGGVGPSRGVCAQGDYSGPLSSTCGQNSTWAYAACPDEDECALGTNECDPISTTCTNTPGSYRCTCRDGYKQSGASSTACVAVCKTPCANNGLCVAPDTCNCTVGFYGADCSLDCGCNGHSNCTLGPGKCDKCMHNTIGPRCETCAPKSYGNATKGGVCTPCVTKCNGNSDECSSVTGECINCRNNTSGSSCEVCDSGYTRFSAGTPGLCVPCDCNGHATTCDAVSGTCACTPESKTTGKDCSKCLQGYSGNPIDGRQCFFVMAKGDLGSAFKVKARERRYFVIRPHYTNVDIRVTVDVLSGAVLNLLSPDDTDALATAIASPANRIIRKRDLVIRYRDYDLLRQMFYLTVEADKDSEFMVYYTQSVSQIDLFVFFSVFFACFFLFLSVIILAWRVKMRYERHQAVVRRGVELQSMARRPMGLITVILSDSLDRPHTTRFTGTPWATVGAFLVGASPDPFEAYRAAVAAAGIVPASLQFTEDGRCAVASAIVELPAPGPGCARTIAVGTTLMSVGPATRRLWDKSKEEGEEREGGAREERESEGAETTLGTAVRDEIVVVPSARLQIVDN